MSYNPMRTHCKEHNYVKIEKFITSPEIGGKINLEYSITTRLQNDEWVKREPLTVFNFSCGDDSDKLSKIVNFMKLLGEDHV